jgi:NADH-quinone oxidoreductase subunit H
VYIVYIIVYVLIGLFYGCICLLLITAIITALTVVERKVLSLLQRRVGLNVLGYRGRLQFIADALKLLGKGLLVPAEANNLLMVSLTSTVLALYYTFWLNSV